MQLRALWYTLGALVWASVPLVAWAQNANPLVPTTAAQGASGCNTVAGAAQSCNICVFGALFQNIINFAIGLSIPIAAVMFAYAGWLYFSNAENTAQIAKAHKIFTTVLIGFAIAVGGWLVVQTILATLTGNAYQSWSNINVQSCSTLKRDLYESLGQLFQNAGVHPQAGAPVPVAISPQSTIITPPPGGACDEAIGCVDAKGNYVGPVTTVNASGNSAAGTQQWAADLQAACANSGLGDCALAQAIMANESSGRPGIVSGAGAVGLMQVTPSTACGLDSSIAGCSTGDYSQVAQALTNPQLNMQVGTQYISQLNNQFGGDPSLIAAAYNGGAKANNYSTVCGGGTAWQCTTNSGYAETRNYVLKVLSTYNQLKN